MGVSAYMCAHASVYEGCLSGIECVCADFSK